MSDTTKNTNVIAKLVEQGINVAELQEGPNFRDFLIRSKAMSGYRQSTVRFTGVLVQTGKQFETDMEINTIGNPDFFTEDEFTFIGWQWADRPPISLSETDPRRKFFWAGRYSFRKGRSGFMFEIHPDLIKSPLENLFIMGTPIPLKSSQASDVM